MRVYFVSYTLMKQSPISWVQLISRADLTNVVVLLKSRDLHWSLMASRGANTKEIALDGVKAIVVADGANPW